MRLLLTLFFTSTLITALAQQRPDVHSFHKQQRKFIPHYADTVKRAVVFQFKYGVQQPVGVLANRFGYSKSIGAEIGYKTKQNLLYGIRADYWFGSKVKDSVLNNLATNVGIISKNGDIAIIRIYGMGVQVGGSFGKIFKMPKINQNSGIGVFGSSGFMLHKIRIVNQQQDVPQLDKTYRKGYDRLTSGPFLGQTVSWFYMSKNRLINYQLQLEALEGFTQSRRTFNYDTMQSDTQKRIDVLLGIKGIWMLPIFIKNQNQEIIF